MQEIAGVIVSPFALGVEVGDAIESVVPDADALSHWREALVGISSADLWRRILVHSLQGLCKTDSLCVLRQVIPLMLIHRERMKHERYILSNITRCKMRRNGSQTVSAGQTWAHQSSTLALMVSRISRTRASFSS